MNSKSKFFIGIDVSKPHFDAALLRVSDHEKQPILTERFLNSSEGLKAFNTWLKNHHVEFSSNTIVLMENTGIYHRLLWSYCSLKNLPLHIGNAAHIKWSFGIARGKNDKIDSVRLCQYAYKEADALRSTPPLNPVLLQLKDLMTARTKLLSQFNSTKTYINELKAVSTNNVHKTIDQAHTQAIQGMKASIKILETEINNIIAKNKDLQKNYKLLVSVPGIGHLTAVFMICCTNNFAGKISGKQLACYAGVVPFEHTSGISIKGKKRVHPMANKDLKRMLHLCSLAVINHSTEFKQYYERKKAEGKHSMSVLNAIRNKIVLRAVAVVNKKEPYVDYQKKVA